MDTDSRSGQAADKKYRDWIASNVDSGNCAGQCRSVTEAMQTAYPELIRVRGHVLTLTGLRPHWWLTTAEGQIVDPTVSQFDEPLQPEDYQEYTGEEPVGRCLECGNLYHSHKFDPACSDNCAVALRCHFNNLRS